MSQILELVAADSVLVTAMGDFITAYVADVQVVRGFVNRVSKPKGPEYAVVTPMTTTRLATNQHAYDRQAAAQRITKRTQRRVQVDFLGDRADVLAETFCTLLRDAVAVEHVAMLYYAAGSGNDFLRDIEADCNDGPVLINKYIKDLPVAEVKGKKYRFLNNLGFGIDGYCCEVGDKQKAASAKTVNYTAIAIKGLLFHYKPTNATVVVDGKQYNFKKVWIAPTMKGRFYGGGMMAAPEQDRLDTDGTLSVMVFGGGGRLRTLMAFPSIFKGEHVKYTKMVHIISGKDISVTFDSPAPVQIDGETILGVMSYHAYACVNAEIKA